MKVDALLNRHLDALIRKRFHVSLATFFLGGGQQGDVINSLIGFPNDFKFIGTKVGIAKQIGNAVPPDLSEAIAQVVKQLLQQAEQRAAA